MAVVAFWGQEPQLSRHSVVMERGRGWLWWHFGVRTPIP